MNNQIEFLVGLIGDDEAEIVLQGYVRKNYKADGTKAKVVAEAPVVKNNPGKHRPHVHLFSSKPWTMDDVNKLTSKVQEIKSVDPDVEWSKVSKQLSRELIRTPSSIMNRIYILGLHKNYATN